MTDPAARHAVPYRLQEPTMTYPTEPKVKASASAATVAAGFVTPSVIRLLDDLFYKGGPIDVPFEHQALIGGMVVLACAWVAGWWAPHVDRLRDGS